MKQIFTNPLRAFMLAVSFLFVLSLSAVEVEIDGINYELVSKIKEATVIDKSSGYYSGAVVIPESVEYEGVSYAVTSIGSSAFSGCSGLTSVTIPNSVTSIGGNAFWDCSSLTSVTIGNSVKSIGDQAFQYCSDLTTVTIGNSVTSIGDYAFHGCSGLTSVTIPNSVTSIGNYAFNFCSGLTSVTIPNSVTSIGNSAFNYCSGLKEVHISDIAAWCNIEFGGSVSNPLYYAHHLYMNGEEVTDLIIPEGVTAIKKSAFWYCSGLTSVTIPNSVTSIGDDAFYDCSGLKEVHISDIAAWCNIEFISYDSNPLSYAHHLYMNGEEVTDLIIPEGVTAIKKDAFRDSSGLTSVTIPNSVTSIEEFAFYGCSGLTSVTIPNSVTSIGWEAFGDCSGLTSVTIPNSVTSIDGAFSGCSGLTSVTIPNSVTSIDATFWGCSGLTSVTIPNSVTIIESYAFSGCSGLTSVTIPNSVTSIGYSAFEDCSGLTSVTIPNSVTRIGGSAFAGCSGLTSVTIPNSVTSIGGSAFNGCSGLTSVTIPNSVTSIGEKAFAECHELTDVYCYAEKVPSTESDAFEGSYVEYATLHVPTASMEDYKTTVPWSSFGTIVSLSGDMPVEPDVPVEPEIEKCETPSVVYKDGKLSLTSGTEGAEFITKVVADDAKTFYDAEIELSASYSIEVFALKSGCENSDTVNVTLCWIDQDGADEENGIINVPSAPVLVQSNGGILTIDGVPAGTDITVYTTSGTEIAKTIATGATTSISVGLSNGTVVIVKIGNRSVKVRLR